MKFTKWNWIMLICSFMIGWFLGPPDYLSQITYAILCTLICIILILIIKVMKHTAGIRKKD